MKTARVIAVMAKETREILRDRGTLAMALALPLVLLFVFGYAITLDVRDVPTGILDQDRSPASRALLDRFVRNGYFALKLAWSSDAEVASSLQSGQVRLAVVIPPSFQRALERSTPAPVQLLVDGTYSATATLVAGYARSIVSAFPSPRNNRIAVETRVWYNPQLRSVNYVVPGLFGVILMAFPPLLTALAITREKETGSIQQVFASPLTPAEFLAGKLVPYGLLAFLQIAMVVVLGFLWFQVPFRGNLPLLAAAGLVYVFCTVGIGLLVSTITRSQLVAMLLVLIVTLMPSFLFSGFLFPVFTMPYVLQLYTRIFPAQYFIDLSRAVVLKGSGLPEVWPNLALLAAYTAVIFAVATWRFRKKVA